MKGPAKLRNSVVSQGVSEIRSHVNGSQLMNSQIQYLKAADGENGQNQIDRISEIYSETSS